MFQHPIWDHMYKYFATVTKDDPEITPEIACIKSHE